MAITHCPVSSSYRPKEDSRNLFDRIIKKNNKHEDNRLNNSENWNND